MRKLIDDALAAPAEAKRQEVFKKALEKRFGLAITVPPGMTNTHFDQFYDMMDRLPVQQTNQDSLEILIYDKTSSGAAFTPAARRPKWAILAPPRNGITKSADRSAEPMNAFSMNSLARNRPRGGCQIPHHAEQDKPGCGNWKTRTLATVIAALLEDLNASAGTA